MNFHIGQRAGFARLSPRLLPARKVCGPLITDVVSKIVTVDGAEPVWGLGHILELEDLKEKQSLNISLFSLRSFS